MSMEAQLAAYRDRKAREQQVLTGSKDGNSGFLKGVRYLWRQGSQSPRTSEKPKEESHRIGSTISTTPTPPSVHRTLGSPNCERRHSKIARSLLGVSPLLTHPTLWKFILWLIIWGLFIELQFGSVFFVISLFYLIYANMRSGPKEEGQLSAYSVFNPNFERLEGTFTAEQFEKELRHGAGSMH